MSEQNRRIVRRLFEEVWSVGNIAILPDLMAADCVCRSAGEAPLVAGLEQYRQFVAAYLALYGHIQIEMQEQISDGDVVATRWAAVLGDDTEEEDAGLMGMSFHRLRDGKIAECWDTWDTFRAAEAVEGVDALEKLIPISG